MAVKVGSFTKSTDTGVPVSQAITGVGFQPKAIILWTVGTTANETFTGGILNSIGLTDGTSSGSCASTVDDATANTQAGRRIARKALAICDSDGNAVAECDLSSFGTDGFTLSWTTNNATAYVINYMALGGDSLTNVKLLEWTMPTSTGSHAVTGVGFQPDAMIGICSNQSSLGGSTVANLSAFFSVGTSGWSHGWSCADNNASGIVYSGLLGGTTIQPYTATVNYRASITSLDVDGFTCNFAIAPAAAMIVFHLCLKGGSYAQGSLNKSTSAETPVTQTVTGLGFTPEAVLPCMSHNSTGQYGLSNVIGASDGTNHRCGNITDEYNAATIEAKSYTSTSKVLAQDYAIFNVAPDQSIDSAATVSFGDGEFSFSWNPNDNKASKIGWMAFALGAVAGGSALLMQHHHHTTFHGGSL